MELRFGIRSAAEPVALYGAKIVGWPAFATPWKTVSTNFGLLSLPNRVLYTSMQCSPHAAVAAPAGTVRRNRATDEAKRRKSTDELVSD